MTRPPRATFVAWTMRDGLSSYEVKCIVEDTTGRLYFGTGRVGSKEWIGPVRRRLPVDSTHNENGLVRSTTRRIRSILLFPVTAASDNGGEISIRGGPDD